MNAKLLSKSRIIFLLSILLLGSCSPAPVAPGQKGDQTGKVVQSNLVRAAAPQVPQSDQQALAEGNRAFAASLYQKLRGGEGNLFFSPYSISLALAMVYAGAGGDTASQIAAALHFTLPPDRLHPAFNALDQYLASLAGASKEGQPTPDSQSGQDFQLKIANSIWGQVDFNFLPALP